MCRPLLRAAANPHAASSHEPTRCEVNVRLPHARGPTRYRTLAMHVGNIARRGGVGVALALLHCGVTVTSMGVSQVACQRARATPALRSTCPSRLVAGARLAVGHWMCGKRDATCFPLRATTDVRTDACARRARLM